MATYNEIKAAHAQWNLPEVAEPFDKLRRVILVEPYIREVHFQDGGTRVADVEEHELGFA